MKTLNQNFAGFDSKFVWQNIEGTATSVESALRDLESKKDTTKSLQDLIDEKGVFEKALGKAREELNAYRKALLGGKIEPDPRLSEDFVSSIIKNTVRYGDSDSLEAKLGLNMSISEGKDKKEDKEEDEKIDKHANNIDKDDHLDLDEFTESQRFIKDINNIEVIIDQLQADIAGGPASKEKDKLASVLDTIETKIKPKIQRIRNGGLTNPEKEEAEANIENTIISELTKSGIDMGEMLEDFAKLARRKGKSGEIDSAIEEFVEDSKPAPAFEIENAAPDSMEALMMENKELTGFFAEYYPPRDFEQDMTTYATSTFSNDDGTTFKGSVITESNFKKEIPNFFWYMNLDGKTISHQLKLYKVDEAFQQLKKAMILDENRSVESTSVMQSASMMFSNVLSALKSNSPSYFKHFEFREEDFKNADNIETLFKNKITGHLNKGKMSLESVKNLTRKLTIEGDPQIIKGLEETISKRFRGGDIAKKYREELESGETRQNFQSWINSKDIRTGEKKVSSMEKLGNFFKFIGRFILQLKVWFGVASEEEEKKLIKIKKERDGGDPTFNEKIETAIGNREALDQADRNKSDWLSEKTDDNANWKAFRKFHIDNTKVIVGISSIDFTSHDNNPREYRDLAPEFGEISPDEFKTKWNTAKSREILGWARDENTIHSTISADNWKWVRENQGNLEFGADASGKKFLKFIENPVDGREVLPISEWSDIKIKELRNNEQDKQWHKFQGFAGKKEETEGIFDGSLDVDAFFLQKEHLFKNPDKPEDANLKLFFKGLFELNKKFFEPKLSADDLRIIIANKGKLGSGLKTKVRPNKKGNDYWYVNNQDGLERVDNGKLESDETKKGLEEGKKQDCFSVNLDGIDFGRHDRFTSVKALVKVLEK